MITSKLNIYLVSDCSGETVTALSIAALAQFENLQVEKYMWPLVRSLTQLDLLLEDVRKNPGIILFTLVDPNLRKYLQDQCIAIGIPAISALCRIIDEIVRFLGVKASKLLPGKYSELDDQYFEKIDTINFTMQHDDGQNLNDVNLADILLIGVSRTSKSPTSFYLAHRGYRTANVPYINTANFPVDLNALNNPLKVGLTVHPERLVQIRQTRLSKMGDFKGNEYTDIDAVQRELVAARKFFNKHGLTVIDVTERAIEETAAEIISIYHETKGRIAPNS